MLAISSLRDKMFSDTHLTFCKFTSETNQHIECLILYEKAKKYFIERKYLDLRNENLNVNRLEKEIFQDQLIEIKNKISELEFTIPLNEKIIIIDGGNSSLSFGNGSCANIRFEWQGNIPEKWHGFESLIHQIKKLAP